MRGPLFARNGTTNPLGKYDAELKTAVPQVIKDEFCAFAMLQGISPGELLRDIVIEKMRGATFVFRAMVQRGRVMGTAGIGQESDVDG